jgi:hypothetical protein
MSRILGDGSEIFEVARIRQGIEADDFDVRLIPQNVANERRPDEAGGTGNKNSHAQRA